MVRLAQEESKAVLTVTDSGSGIRPEALPFVFERFRQASIADTKAGGLGLGLAIVKHIVEMHEGTVTAASAGAGPGSDLHGDPAPDARRRGRRGRRSRAGRAERTPRWPGCGSWWPTIRRTRAT